MSIRALIHSQNERTRWAVMFLFGAILWGGSSPSWSRAKDFVSFKQDEKTHHVHGKVVVEAQDGGLLLLAEDGVLWIVQPSELIRRDRDDEEFQPLSHQQVAKRLQDELPSGFRLHTTAHYVICYNTTTAYAEWCGALYERLFRAFYAYWKYRGYELREPEFPLAALVFKDQASYAEYSRQELGEATRSIIGFYSMRTNRVNMYDLTGADELGRRGPARSASHVNQILSQPAAERTVATIVHEATHQLAFNSGLQVRYADIPFWLSEGIAVYFETPDLKSSKGWRNVGGINRLNLVNFRRSLKDRGPDSLITLLSDDRRFRDPQQSATAYAEAWALNYFLLRTRRKEFVAYLQAMAKQGPLVEFSAEERIQRFKQAFGADLADLDGEFVRYMRRIR